MASDVEKEVIRPNDEANLLTAKLGMLWWDSPQGRIWIGRIRDNVPFIAITLVILLFWFISGDRFMSVRNWTFIAQRHADLTIPCLVQPFFAVTQERC